MALQRPKLGLYVDDSNLYYRGKASGWMIDYKKLYQWVAKENNIIYAKYFMGMPGWEPARSINEAFAKYYKGVGYQIIQKPLKKIKDLQGKNGFRNKCNFDVEIHDEIIKDLANIDMVYLVSGDSDFVRTKETILKAGKKIKFLAYENNCAWEIRNSWHVFLDEIRNEIERMVP